MVYTVTFNPALDYVMNVKSLRTDDISRSYSEKIYYGGKGVNVSAVLSSLGIETEALGFAAGFTGAELCRLMNKDGIKSNFVFLNSGNTRINVKIKYGKELDINAGGPSVPEEKINELFLKLNKIKSGDYLVLAGSVPGNLPNDIYSRIIEFLADKGIRFVVDATGEQLLNVLKYKPFLIKPNHHELGEIFGKKLTSADEIIHYGKELRKLGARNALISRGGDGAVLLTEAGDIYDIPAVQGELVNSAGCGDSMVAGFIAGMIKENNFEYALKLSVAASAATAFSPELAKADEINKIFKNMQ